VSIYDSESYEPCRSVAHAMGQLRTEMLAALDRELTADKHVAAIGVTAAQFIVMARLAASERKKSASDLCKEMSYDAGAMTRMIDRLESKGLVRRARCPQDRRLVYLELTEQGRAVYPRLREISMAVQNRFLRGFTRADARQLESMLERMLENAA
jgi:DNA-binding MarR family transcriptional regulator